MNVGRIEYRYPSQFRVEVPAKNPMGAVYVKVRLTNDADHSRMVRGEINPQQVRSIEAMALVDTGSTRSALPRDLVELLGLTISASTDAVFADGRSETVGLTGGLRFRIGDRETVDEAAILGNEVLIGQTVLEKLDLLVDCTNQTLMANPKHPNGASSRA